MSGELVAREYARVLAHLAPEESAWILSYFRALGEAIEGAADLKNFFNHPAIPVEEKLHCLEASSPRKFGPVARRVLEHLVKRRATALFRAIADEMELLSREARNIHTVSVTSAAPLNTGEQEALTKRLSTYLSGEARVLFFVEPALISGLLVKIGDTVIDNTVRTDLGHIRRKLMAASST